MDFLNETELFVMVDELVHRCASEALQLLDDFYPAAALRAPNRAPPVAPTPLLSEPKRPHRSKCIVARRS